MTGLAMSAFLSCRASDGIEDVNVPIAEGINYELPMKRWRECPTWLPVWRQIYGATGFLAGCRAAMRFAGRMPAYPGAV